MHRDVKTLSLQATVDRYLDREMHPAESAAFIQSLDRHPRRLATLNAEIRFRNALQAARPKPSADFSNRLRGAIQRELDRE